MRSPTMLMTGLLIAAAGALFTLQGVGAVQGSSMSNTTFWSVAGPVIAVIGLALAWRGSRKRPE